MKSPVAGAPGEHVSELDFGINGRVCKHIHSRAVVYTKVGVDLHQGNSTGKNVHTFIRVFNTK